LHGFPRLTKLAGHNRVSLREWLRPKERPAQAADPPSEEEEEEEQEDEGRQSTQPLEKEKPTGQHKVKPE
jgi:hypothetical protein